MRVFALLFASMKLILMAAAVSTTLAGLGLATGVATAAPFCFKTGPGYQKCVIGGDDLTPTYQGPEVYTGGNVPWVPSAPAYVPTFAPAPPVAAPPTGPTMVSDDVFLPMLDNEVQHSMQAFVDDPANGRTQDNVHFGRVSLGRTGARTFAGTVAVSAGGSPEQEVPMHVAYDDAGNMTWRIDS